MSAPIHLAAQRIQTDTAGLTGAARPASVPEGAPAAPTLTETAGAVLHGESGSLHYLFDNELVAPVSTALEATTALRGPHGGRVPFAPSPAVPAAGAASGHAAAALPPAANAAGPNAAFERAASTVRGWGQRIRDALTPSSPAVPGG